jgi:antitoxin YefM
MDTLMPISEVRANLPGLVDKIEQECGRILITVNGQPKVVMMSSDELESLEETAEILAIPGAKRDIMKGLEG